MAAKILARGKGRFTRVFPPSWPRRWLARWSRRSTTSARAPAPRRAAPSRLLVGALALHLAVQVALPLRHWLYPGTLAWNEDGARFAWQVMVREKHGSVTYIVRFPDGRRLQVPPRRYLTARQERELAGYPDLILALGRRIGAEMHAAGHADVRVTVDARVSLNGRPAEAMIDPEIDLLTVSDVGARTWVTPAPSTEPIHLRARP
jgi:vitamin K-dependent gamma-carboxylase